MPGLLRFDTVAQAKEQGFEIYDRTNDGYLVRKKINGLWQLAIVAPRPRVSDPDPEC